MKRTIPAIKPLRHSLPVILACLVSPALAQDSIDLSGPWRFAPDVTDAGLAATPKQWKFPETIELPGQVAALHVQEARIEPSFAGRSVKVIVTANTNGTGEVTAKVRYAGPLREHFESESFSADLAEGRAELTTPINRDPRAWNELSPHLYQAQITLESAAGKDVVSENFGFRDLGKKNGRLAINGNPILLRGALECAIFPRTGYPPTDVAAWRRILKICKAHGLNHIRFHAWCPPEAAFIADDEEGFYFQVEASAWASNGGAEIGSGMPLDAWIDVETARMIREYGNHPSFLMRTYGNEPGGPNHAKWLQEYVARWKAKEARRYWTTAAGWRKSRSSATDFF